MAAAVQAGAETGAYQSPFSLQQDVEQALGGVETGLSRARMQHLPTGSRSGHGLLTSDPLPSNTRRVGGGGDAC